MGGADKEIHPNIKDGRNRKSLKIQYNYLAFCVYQLIKAWEGGCLGGTVTVYVYSGLMEVDSSVYTTVPS